VSGVQFSVEELTTFLAGSAVPELRAGEPVEA
jgi:hypothetical protein